jgi:hypothetical protein
VQRLTAEDKARNKEAKKAAKKNAVVLAPADDYDPSAPMLTEESLILGIDPGRTHLLTVVYVDEKGKKHTWRLSRGQYYTEGGILTENRLKARRFAPLAAAFAGLTAEGGALRASTPEELRAYFRSYASCHDAWWTEALKRRESRSKMQRHIGKTAVMARFLSALRKDAEALMAKCKRSRIEVAYGSAGLNMAASGKGEAAVPTSSTYKAVNDEFHQHGHRVTPTWEQNTSAVGWQTRKRYENVYKRFDGPGNAERLCHTTAKYGPVIGDGTSGRRKDLAATKAVLQDTGAKAVRRRGGALCGGDGHRSDGASDEDEEKKKRKKQPLRYPMVRGLRFCPERRMFYDRDEASAIAIGGLRRLEMEGKGRPTAFRCKSQDKTQINGSSMMPARAEDAASDGVEEKKSALYTETTE